MAYQGLIININSLKTMDKKIPSVALGLSLTTLALGIGLTIPSLTKAPAPITRTPQELSNLTSNDGKNWAIVKVWKYKYSPSVVPVTDLKVIQTAMESGQYQIILLESEDFIQGWYLVKITDRWVLLPVNEKFTNKYPEIFSSRG